MLLKRKAPSAKSNIKNDPITNDISNSVETTVVKEEPLETLYKNLENSDNIAVSNTELNIVDVNTKSSLTNSKFGDTDTKSSLTTPLVADTNVTITNELSNIDKKSTDEILSDKSKFPSKKKSERLSNERKRKSTASINSSKAKNKIKPPKSLDSGVYVECDSCHKTRYLKDTLNPSAIPSIWTCEMTDNKSLDCSVPQENFENSIGCFVNNKYTLGSVVWAKAPGFCWWPAIIDEDPDLDMFYWCYEHSDDVSHYHVTFLDDDVSRSWIATKDLKVFCSKADMSSMKLKKYKKNYVKSLSKAVESAEKCLTLSLQECLDKYSFAIRYTGKSNLWTSTTNSGKRKSNSKQSYSNDESLGELESKSSSGKNLSKNKTTKTEKKCENLSIEVSKIEAKCEILTALNQQTKHDLIVNNSIKETRKKVYNKKNKKPDQQKLDIPSNYEVREKFSHPKWVKKTKIPAPTKQNCQLYRPEKFPKRIRGTRPFQNRKQEKSLSEIFIPQTE